MTANFVHLRLHTEFSLVDSLVRIKKLVKRVADLNMPACGISDQCNFYGLIKFYKAAQGAGIKPIIGSDFWVASSDSEGKPTLLTLFAMNNTGYKNIIELISRGWRQGQQQGVAYVQREWISEFSEGVIALLAFLAVMVIYIVDSMKLYAVRKYYDKTQRLGAATCLGVIGYLFAGIFNDSVISVAPVFWIVLGVGVALNFMNRKELNKKRNK